MGIDSDRTFHFEADVEGVWAAFERVDQYQQWWPWLRRFEADGLTVGARWRCSVRTPAPYSLSFAIELVHIVPGTSINAVVSGDIAGDASLSLRSRAGGGTDLRLVSSLEPRRRTLSVVTRLIPWLARQGHDWVLDSGQREFEDRALGRAPR